MNDPHWGWCEAIVLGRFVNRPYGVGGTSQRNVYKINAGFHPPMSAYRCAEGIRTNFA